ncbi:Phox homologous domain-containing protein [Mucor lusitanicus]|uniref:Phox homologous domain-containing protein n=1 Tax=Mucor circinelloides f. lusitanicus TaxID=29924 RepID=A0A8H4BHM7_MUCCL|nr:Phox homologous domain-containing protein [Mucor lusitanicus]
MTNNIQSIFIKQTETRHDPKAYTAYRIDIQAAVRQWHIWKRYSDFTKLHEQLTHTFPDVSLPAHLPHKRIFPPTFHSSDKVEDRRQGLEDYLRTLLSCRDDRWRKTDIWNDFLALPEHNNMTAVSPSSSPTKAKEPVVTFGSWLDEYDDLLTLSREIRSLINSRNAHTSQQEVSDAMQCEVKAKKGLMTLTARLSILESSLHDNQDQFVADGEARRREDKLNSLKVEKDVLVQLVNATRQDLTKSTKKKPQQNVKRAATTGHHTKVGGGRAFGSALLKQQQQQKLQETEFTKGLDNQELLNYQTQVMKDQDLHIEQFSQLLGRQKELGVAINHELENQIDVLESLDIQVDNTQTKLAFANKKLSKIK